MPKMRKHDCEIYRRWILGLAIAFKYRIKPLDISVFLKKNREVNVPKPRFYFFFAGAFFSSFFGSGFLATNITSGFYICQ
jgi:hypothetical protein